MATNLEICEEALRKIDVLGEAETASGDMADIARRNLERMLRAWQNKGLVDWVNASQQVTLTTANSYVLATRAQNIANVNFKQSGRETPMIRMTRQEYDELPNKDAKGTPTQWYYDKSPTAGTLYIWPSLAVAAGQTLQVTYASPFAEIDLTATAQIPPEWEDAVVYQLGKRLADDYQVNLSPSFMMTAQEALDDALAADRPDSVFFMDASYLYASR